MKAGLDSRIARRGRRTGYSPVYDSWYRRRSQEGPYSIKIVLCRIRREAQDNWLFRRDLSIRRDAVVVDVMNLLLGRRLRRVSFNLLRKWRPRMIFMSIAWTFDYDL